MPSWTSDAVVFVDFTGSVDAAVLAALQNEQFLLIQSCTVEHEQGAPEVRRNSAGKAFLTAYPPGELVWQIEGRVAEWDGLSDYHGGTALTRQSLAFANGPAFRLPFQFEDDGVLVYERPRQSLNPGTLPGISFAIRQVNGGTVDETVEEPSTPPAALLVEMEVQNSKEVSDQAKNVILEAAFNGVVGMDAEPLLLTLYFGNPYAGGTALHTPVELTAWTTYDEPVFDYVTRGRNQSAIDITETFAYERTATHFRLTRNAKIILGGAELLHPLTIPAYYGVRIPANALSVTLMFPYDGDNVTSTDRPANRMLRYLLGQDFGDTFPSGNLYVAATDDNWASPTTLEGWVVPATSTYWAVSGVTVTPQTLSDDNAPGGGWAVEAIIVKFSVGAAPVAPLIMRKRFVQSVTVGNPVVLDEAPILNLNESPEA